MRAEKLSRKFNCKELVVFTGTARCFEFTGLMTVKTGASTSKSMAPVLDSTRPRPDKFKQSSRLRGWKLRDHSKGVVLLKSCHSILTPKS